MEISKNWEKQLEVLVPQTLCPKISFLAQKLRAVGREQTDRHTEKTKLKDPFFCNLFFYFYWVENENQNYMQK